MMMAFLAPKKHLPWLAAIFASALIAGVAIMLAT